MSVEHTNNFQRNNAAPAGLCWPRTYLILNVMTKIQTSHGTLSDRSAQRAAGRSHGTAQEHPPGRPIDPNSERQEKLRSEFCQGEPGPGRPINPQQRAPIKFV